MLFGLRELPSAPRFVSALLYYNADSSLLLFAFFSYLCSRIILHVERVSAVCEKQLSIEQKITFIWNDFFLDACVLRQESEGGNLFHHSRTGQH